LRLLPSLPYNHFPPCHTGQLEKESTELMADKETFQQKSKKLDAIMKQVQGLSTD